MIDKRKKKKTTAAELQYINAPFQSGFDIEEWEYTKRSKQLLDGKLREITKDDLQGSLPFNIERGKVEVAIQNGIGALDFTFMENWILHALQILFTRAGWPRKLKYTRGQLYSAMGIRSYMKDGRKYYHEGPDEKFRARVHGTLLGLSTKTYLFRFYQESGHNKKGKITGRMALTYSQIIKTVVVYVDVRQLELRGMEFKSGQKNEPMKKRLSHYETEWNPYAFGDMDRYFRYLPSGMPNEIIEYYRKKGGRVSSHDFDFIDYLYTESRERIEINYMKLVAKLRIKRLQDKKNVRRILNRVYTMAKDLGWLLMFEIDQPGLRARKDILHLNPKRFYKLKGGKK